jgi:acyl-CoA thioesterase
MPRVGTVDRVTGAFFEAIGPDRYTATPHTRGPWSPDLMHAGPPTALLAHTAAAAVGHGGLRLARIAVDILAPVPVGPVEVQADVVRPGAQISLVEVALRAAGRTLMMARCWFVRRLTGIDLPATPITPAPPMSSTELAIPDGWGRGYLDAVEWRWVSGSLQETGPASVWARPRVALIADRATTGAERLLIVSDSASGISAVANPRDLLFVNLDLCVHFRREPTAEWIWMTAETRLGGDGSGVAASVIGDREGDLARTEQVLFVQPHPPTP